MKKNYQVPTVSIIETETYELLAGTGSDSGTVITNGDINGDNGGTSFGGGSDEPPRAHQAFDIFEEEDETTTLKINLNVDHLLGD